MNQGTGEITGRRRSKKQNNSGDRETRAGDDQVRWYDVDNEALDGEYQKTCKIRVQEPRDGRDHETTDERDQESTDDRDYESTDDSDHESTDDRHHESTDDRDHESRDDRDHESTDDRDNESTDSYTGGAIGHQR